VPGRLVANLRIAIEVSRALDELHRLDIFHVDLNPMNVLHRSTSDRPVIRIIDFESSYERRRHQSGVPYSPPTTPGYSAPEVTRQAPDARADVYSLGAVLYTLLGGFQRSPVIPPRQRVTSDRTLDPELRDALLTAVDPDPDRRFTSILAFQAALGSYLEGIWPGRQW
jgi:serine/threonine protein kinase